MSEIEETDQTLTTDSTLIEPDPEVKERKPKSGLFGLIAIASSFVILISSFLITFNDNGTVYKAADEELQIIVTISAPEFRSQSNSSVCSGVKTFPKISDSEIQISATGWNETIKLGDGELDSDGNCIYDITVATPTTFKGGLVRAKTIFSIATTDVVSQDVGDILPYDPFTIDYAFN